MSDLIIEATSKTPGIEFKTDTQTLVLNGRSIPENAAEFYTPVFEWLDHHLASVSALQTLEIRLEYFNTSSSKSLLDIMRRYQKAVAQNQLSVKVVWCYESDDEDMQEAGEDYCAITGLDFEYLPTDKL
jgi:hypothetical protein